MDGKHGLDCVTIGYNDPPFAEYERLIRRYGEDSEAYRDLKFSFVEVDGRKLNYVDLLNLVARSAGHAATFASGEIPNLAAVYLTNFLRRRGLSSEYVNLYQLEKDRLGALLDADPLCVAITTTFYVVNFPVTEMVEFIRARNDRVKVVVGGPLVGNHARNYRDDDLQAALRDIGADFYILESQGEQTLAELVRALGAGGDVRRVANLYHREDGRYAFTGAVPENNDLDENYIDWRALGSDDLGPTLQTRTARSCAFKCAFCNYPTRAGALTLASLDTMEKEFDSMAERGNVGNVVFIDDTFNVPLPRFKDICRLLIRKRYGFKWFSYFRCSNSDQEAVDLMAESGCAGVFLGIESGSPTILKNMAKAAKIEQYTRGIEMLHRHGIVTFGSFIIGFPGETEETVQETIDFINETKVDYYRAQMWYNEAGTPIHDQRDRFNIMGDGFVWSHASMDSLEAMEHIERLFLRVTCSEWLPQWSFDFWIIPYLMGKGLSRERFGEFMRHANQLLRLEIAAVEPREKERLSRQRLRELMDAAKGWSFAQA
jgi:p-methyltransferase